MAKWIKFPSQNSGNGFNNASTTSLADVNCRWRQLDY